MSDAVYCYPPDHMVLEDKLKIQDTGKLDRTGRNLLRFSPGVSGGEFDLACLKAIHHHLFEDVYDGAGKLRTVEISKNASQFRRQTSTGKTDLHRRQVAAELLHGLSAADFARGETIGDVDYVQPTMR